MLNKPTHPAGRVDESSLPTPDGRNERFKIPDGQKFNINGQVTDAFGLQKGMQISATKVVEVPETVVNVKRVVTGQLPPPPPPAPDVPNLGFRCDTGSASGSSYSSSHNRGICRTGPDTTTEDRERPASNRACRRLDVVTGPRSASAASQSLTMNTGPPLGSDNPSTEDPRRVAHERGFSQWNGPAWFWVASEIRREHAYSWKHIQISYDERS
jgi:hypothetical protein